MNREVLRIILVFLVCFIVAVGCCMLCACLFQRVEPFASAEVYERELPLYDDLSLRSEVVRSTNVTLPDDGVVGSNAIYNSNFIDPIYPRPASMAALTEEGFYNWYASNITYSDGISFSITSAYNGLNYYIVFPSAGTYTFSFYVKSTTTIVQGLRVYNGSSWVANVFGNISSSDDYVLRSSTFTVTDTSSPSFIYLWGAFAGSISIKWCKVEVGSSFTGYVPNYQDIQNYGYDDGYDDGYDVGFVEGSTIYARRTVTHTMREIESPTVHFGWSDLGITSTSELEGCVFSCLPWWFTYRGYVVVDNNYVFLRDTSTNEVIGVNIICSTGSLVGVTDITEITFPVAVVTLYEDTSGFIVYGDSSFPTVLPDPSLFPNVYNVDITVSLGFENWIEQMSSSAEAIGYNRGRDVGYVEGKTAGYQQGFDYGIQQAQMGTWRGLFSALISVPISAIINFFNFEVFGLNLLNVFQTIVIASLFIFLVRLLLGKVLE